MHGLINRSVQSYVCRRYGTDFWVEVAERASLGFTSFEAMLTYDDAVTSRVLNALGDIVDRSRGEMMEDIGLYLVTDETLTGLRRLLRFGGVDFEDFLNSLDEMPDFVRLAVPHLNVPQLELHPRAEGLYILECRKAIAGFDSLMIGVLRGMADEYGALALFETVAANDKVQKLSIQLVDNAYAEARHFTFAEHVG